MGLTGRQSERQAPNRLQNTATMVVNNAYLNLNVWDLDQTYSNYVDLIFLYESKYENVNLKVVEQDRMK